MRLKAILAGIVVVVGLFFGSSGVSHAYECTGCQVELVCIYPRGVEICTWVDGCNGCTGGSCPSGQYRAPDGSCHDVGLGGTPPGGGGCWEGM